MSKKEEVPSTKDSIPKIIEIEEQEIEKRQPPNNKIIKYHIINDDEESE
ncbi:MAG: hypothetical protein ACFE8N_10665 [Promethearchaeota archaeon]